MNSILKNRFTGFFKGIIRAICPNKEQLEEILGEETEEPSDYFYTKRDGTKVAKIELYIENVSGGELFKHTIYIEDNPEIFSSGASRYINSYGETQITNSEDNLFDNFKQIQKVTSWKNPDGQSSERYKPGSKPDSIEIRGEKQYRIAKKGECELTNLILKINPTLKFKENVFLDIGSILEGNIDSLDFKIGQPTFVAFAYIINDEEKGYPQKLFKEFIELDMFGDFVKNQPISKNYKKFRKWHDDFSFISDGTIYNFDRLQCTKEEFIPVSKEFSEDDSEY